MDIIDIPYTHAGLSELATRNPGEPPNSCHGIIIRVDGNGDDIPASTPWLYDDALSSEGVFGKKVPVALFRCIYCRTTLVVSKCVSDKGKEHLHIRNPWLKPEREPVHRIRIGTNGTLAAGRPASIA